MGHCNPVDVLHPEINWSSGEDESVILCPRECITDGSMCLPDKEQESPSQSTVMEFVLPLKIHFRYCWLYTGVPWHNTRRLGNRTEQLTEREWRHLNRTLMAHENAELCSQVCSDQQDMKAFWLTADGRLVYVDRLAEDIEFRRLRQQNLRVALSLWTSNPDLCGPAMKASALAHANLTIICGEAMSLSQGRFYNVYAKYPLPINTNGVLDVSFEVHGVQEMDIDAKEIRNGQALLIELHPLYTEYLSFITDSSTVPKLKERVWLLGAQWLVEQDLSELQFSLNQKRNWLARMFTRLALFLTMS